MNAEMTMLRFISHCDAQCCHRVRQEIIKQSGSSDDYSKFTTLCKGTAFKMTVKELFMIEFLLFMSFYTSVL